MFKGEKNTTDKMSNFHGGLYGHICIIVVVFQNLIQYQAVYALEISKYIFFK